MTKYLAIKPTSGAGIGHQFAEWNTGRLMALKNNVSFAHTPFRDKVAPWERFLNFGFGEKEYQPTLMNRSIKFIGIGIISFNGVSRTVTLRTGTNRERKNFMEESFIKDTLFVQDCNKERVNTKDHTVHINMLRDRYSLARQKNNIPLNYKPGKISVAVHVRRDDILSDKHWQSRGLSNNYYINIITSLRNIIQPDQLDIHVFSDGNRDQLGALAHQPQITLHCRENEFTDFHHLVMADILVASRSGFSYLPSLLSTGHIFAPSNFWHTWPKRSIIADKNGDISKNYLNLVLNSNSASNRGKINHKNIALELLSKSAI